jgi:hypothetical protein
MRENSSWLVAAELSLRTAHGNAFVKTQSKSISQFTTQREINTPTERGRPNGGAADPLCCLA